MLYTMTDRHYRNKNHKQNNKRKYKMNPESYFLALRGSFFWPNLEGGTSLALRSISLVLASVSCALALASSLASARGLVSLPLPLSLAPSTPWPWSLAWLGPFDASGRGRSAWIARGCTEDLGAVAEGDGRAIGTSRKGLAVLASSQCPCPWAKGVAAPRPQLHMHRGLFGTP